MHVTLGADGTVVSASPALERALGYRPAGLRGTMLRTVFHPDDVPALRQALDGMAAGAPAAPRYVRCLRADGSWRRLKVLGTPPPEGSAIGTVLLDGGDTTEGQDSEEALAASDRHFRALSDAAREGVWQVDAHGTTTFVNWRMASMLGLEPQQLVGLSVFAFIDEPERAAVQARLEAGAQGAGETYEQHFCGPDGRRVLGLVSANPLFGSDGQYAGSLHLVTDLSEPRAMAAQIQELALRDALTGLPNRAGALRLLSQGHSQVGPGGCLAVILLDLDRFSVINASLGEAAGDLVLKRLAERLVATCGAGAEVARTGGDEFCVIFTSTEPAAESLFLRLPEAVCAPPVDVAGQRVLVTASLGLVTGGPEDDPSRLLQDAQAAMDESRATAHPVVFTPELRARHRAAVETEVSLLRAIEEGELRVYYQPIVDLVAGTVVAAEALVRWEHPDRGIIPPGEFIPLAEATGLIVPLGTFVLQQALRDAATWPPRPDGGSYRVCVNLAAAQLAAPGLVDTVAAALAEAGVGAHRLCIEVTESAVMLDVGAGATALQRLRDLGVSLSLDDFGTGFCSLAYLQRFPIQALKIDRSFVAALGTPHENRAIVNAVVRMADALGLATVAEGVETDAQLDAVRGLGCTLAQGYLFARPQPPEAFAADLALRSAGRDRRRPRRVVAEPAGEAAQARPLRLTEAIHSQLGPVATAILDAADTMVVITDRDGVIQYVNPAFTVVTGYRADEAIGGTPRLLRSGVQDEAFYRNLWSTVLSGDVWHGELINRRKDGTLYTDEMTIVPVSDPDQHEQFFVAIKRDVSARIQSLTAASPIGIAHAGRDGRLLYVNSQAEVLLGGAFVDLVGMQWLGQFLDSDRPEIIKRLTQAYDRDPQAVADDGRFLLRTGRWVDLRYAPLVSHTGTHLGVVVALEDVTQQVLAAAATEKRERFVRGILDSLQDPTAVIDPAGCITAVNAAWTGEVPWILADLVPAGLGECLRLGARRDGSEDAERIRAGVGAVLGGERSQFEYEFPAPGTDPGERRWCLLRVSPLQDFQGAVLTLTDVTWRKQAELRLHHHATHDLLTGLLNRAGLQARLGGADGPAVDITGMCALFVDLDRFKGVNDTYGHKAGDALLVAASRRIVEQVRSGDIVARVGGDEFLALLPATPGNHGPAVAARIEHAMAAVFQLDGLEVSIGASVGVALARPGESFEELTTRADASMYEVKLAHHRRRQDRAAVALPEGQGEARDLPAVSGDAA